VKLFPICLVGLETELAVIVGGGVKAARSAEALLEAGAEVTAFAPLFSSEFEALKADCPRLSCIARAYQPGDLGASWLVIAASSDPGVNHQVWEEARRERKLIYVVDDPARSNFIVPAVVRRSRSALIDETRRSQSLTQKLRDKLETSLGAEYGVLGDLLPEARPSLPQTSSPGKPRLQAALRAVDRELLQVFREQGADAARRRLYARLSGEE
jgi:siroheme synthase-like protein